jgi:hypothetical protein
MPLGRQFPADGQDVVAAELEIADRIGAGLDQQLCAGVQHDADENQEEADQVHGRLTTTYCVSR